MHIKQKKWNNSAEFLFEEDHFTYQIQDESGSRKKRFSYLNLPSTSEFYESTDRNVLFLIGAITFLVVGIAQYFIFMVWKDQIKLSMASVSIVCYVLFRLTETQYTAIPTKKGIISVIKDKSHELIIKELYSRRNEIIKEQYGSVDYENNVENELDKFKWLLKEEIITTEEYEAAEARLLSYNASSDERRSETLQ